MLLDQAGIDLVSEIKQGVRKFKRSKYMKDDFSLKSFQEPAALMSCVVPNMVNGYDVGLGKSAISLAALCKVKEKGWHTEPMLIYAPGSSLYQWRDEVMKFTHLSVHVLDDGPEVREKYYQNWGEHDVVISTYALMNVDKDRYLDTILGKTQFLFDEILYLKNPSSQLYQVANRILLPYAKRAQGLSATILKNRLEEPYHIFKLLIPEALPSYEAFVERYCKVKQVSIGNNRFAKKTVNVDYHNIQEFKKVIEPYYIDKKKREVKEHLPSVIIKPIYTLMGREQSKLYANAVDGFLQIGDSLVDLENSLAKITRCQQISDNPKILEHNIVSSKEPKLLELLSEIDMSEKVVIFNKSRTGVDYMVENTLKKYNPLFIHGGIDNKKRREVRDIFTEDPDRNVIIINTAAREAINLQVAKHFICYNMDWGYGDFIQLVGRVNRLGSKHDINYVYLIMNFKTVDEYIYQSVMRKESWFVQLLGDVGYMLDVDGERKFIDGFAKFCKQNRVF